MTSSTRYSWQPLRAGPLKLDGGGMFGVIPRVIWSRAMAPDEKHRITVAHNCLLLTRIDERGKTHRVLIETGSGDKLDPKMREIFGLTDYTIVEALRDAGCRCEDVDRVIVSHLHFDHAGGLTRRVREGESPDWSDSSGARVKLVFPNARIIAQMQEWHDALANNSVMTRTLLSWRPDILAKSPFTLATPCVDAQTVTDSGCQSTTVPCVSSALWV